MGKGWKVEAFAANCMISSAGRRLANSRAREEAWEMACAREDPSLVQRIGITGRKRTHAVTLLSLQLLSSRLRDSDALHYGKPVWRASKEESGF